MLLAAGVYPTFIASIAELTTLRIRLRAVIALGSIAGAAGASILLLAGTMRSLVVDERWVMYSLFIGLTLGGVPLVWRLARPASIGLITGTVLAFSAMVAMALGTEAQRSGAADPLLLGLSGLAADSTTNAQAALSALDTAINTVNTARGNLGAAQNRLQSSFRSILSARENLSASESRIRDVDVAMETADLTRNSILQQAATSVLAQANTNPQLALSLLG